MPLAERVRDTNSHNRFPENNVRFLYHDRLGSVTTVYKGSNHLDSTRYGAWGEFLDSSHPHHGKEIFSSSDVELAYNGKPYDGFTGMYNYGFRHYNPEHKQWITQDPIRDGYNWYAFMGGVGDLVNNIDVDGLTTFTQTNGVVIAVTEDGSKAIYRLKSGKGTQVGNIIVAPDASDWEYMGETMWVDAHISPDTGKAVGRVHFW